MLVLNDIKSHSYVIAIERVQSKLASNYYCSYIKRAIDTVLSLIGLIVCTPVIILACLCILIDSPTMPIFKQNRIGKNGKVFQIYKLRTMRKASGHWAVRTYKNDWRITKIGQILRATKIDELPQLINILKGEMSFVGSRPLSTVECEHIEQLGFLSYHPGFYLTATPGLIGLEQVNRQNQLSYAERFSLNYKYESRLSWQLDLEIFLKAVFQCKWVCYSAAISAVTEFFILGSF